ncbi:MAG: hypothetical protein QXU52_01240 [Fervidicoccaceae archaeon]
MLLAAASYQDARERMISYRTLYAAAPVAAALYALLASREALSPAVAALSLSQTGLMAGAIYLLSARGLMGRADAPLALLVGALNPYLVLAGPIPTTPLVATFAIGLVYPLAVVSRNVYCNSRRVREFSRLTRGLPLFKRAVLFLAGKTMSVDEFKRSRFYFPLVVEGAPARLVFDAEREPLSGAEHEVSGSHVIASYGMAFALLLLIGYATYSVLIALGLLVLIC